MKATKSLLGLLALSLAFAGTSLAQEQIAIPLSNPGEPGKLDLGIIRGSIKVTGYKGKEVIINYNNGDHYENENDEANNRPATKNGLRRISVNSVGFEVEEHDNEIEIGGASPNSNIDFEISVPHNFSLYLSTVNGGEIEVENVDGEMEISNVNGEITLTNVSGSAVANTVNGDIKATFSKVAPNKPMAFSNLNGDINITLPAGARLSAKMKSEWGEVFTDFDMAISKTDRENIDVDSGVYKVSVNNWIYGKINGGGPEYLFKSMRGDIYIRKQ